LLAYHNRGGIENPPTQSWRDFRNAMFVFERSVCALELLSNLAQT
jgi:hypothetical protein